MARRKERPRTWHIIKKNHTNWQPKDLLFLDTETKGIPETPSCERHFMRMAWTCRCKQPRGQEGVYTEGWNYWEKPLGLLNHIDTICTKQRALHIIGSNILFDLVAMGFFPFFTDRGWTLDFCYGVGMTFILCIKKDGRRLKCLSTQNFIAGSVESMGETIGYKKLKVNFKTVSDEQLKKYCRRDVEIIKRVFLDYLKFLRVNDLGRFCVTRASQSLQAYRHRFMDYPIEIHLDSQTTKLERAAYYGGLTECFRLGNFRGKDITCLDVNSMYPFIMAQHDFPYKYVNPLSRPSLSYTQSALKQFDMVAHVRVKTDVPLYPIKHNGRTVFPVGEFKCHLCTGSLKEAIKRDHLREVYEASEYERGPIFKDYVGTLYPLKAQFKKDGNALWEKLVKLFLNSLYGKWGQQRTKVVQDEDVSERGFHRESIWDVESQSWSIEQVMFNRFQRFSGKEETNNSLPVISAHVTDYARLYLWSLIEEIGRDKVFYCDTDSLMIETKHIGRLKSKMHPTRLGALDIKGNTRNFRLYGCKDYFWRSKRVIKGIRAEAEEVKQGHFMQTWFPSINTLLKQGLMDGFPINTIKKVLKREYMKGTVTPKGFVEPFVFPLHG